MAFNFNWSPLTADGDFYERATNLLTTALNKSPKPPIIVDDILVTELNLGSVPPDLEILEIGDIAEDRFRGIFKMTYSGDAFLTLRTRVQANPLNTYLSSKPNFTSPKPLAAASGLTIPLSITLSEIKLSAFIILVFSRQKGLTLVFRNDPLESLKVSSTFDSIQFVRDYLQRTIEGQLRSLMMEELPAIIHRLSLRLWCKDQLPKEDGETSETEGEHVAEEPAVNPLATPPIDPVDSNGNVVDPQEIAAFSINDGQPVQSLFSRHSLLRLAALTQSHRTLSLHTPGIKDTLYRAWGGLGERTDGMVTMPPTPLLSKQNSYVGQHPTSTLTSGTSVHTYSFSETGSTAHGSSVSSRAGLMSPGLSLGSGRSSRTYQNRRKKKRVVNLRKRSEEDSASPAESTDATPESGTPATSEAASSVVPEDETLMTSVITEEPVETKEADRLPTPKVAEIQPPQYHQSAKVRFQAPEKPGAEPTAHRPLFPSTAHMSTTPRAPGSPNLAGTPFAAMAAALKEHQQRRKNGVNTGGDNSSILEHAWINKMMGEISRRVYEETSRREGFWDETSRSTDDAPPAYSAQV